MGLPGSGIRRLRTFSDREINVDVFINPRKYLVRLPLRKIVADAKVYRPGVERYKQKILNNEEIPPIIVVKHPRRDVYAVLDGHHRYYAYVELGRKEVDCALAGDLSSVLFHATRMGVLQPPPEVTEYAVAPALQLHENLEQFLSDFQKDPYRFRRLMRDQIKKIVNGK